MALGDHIQCGCSACRSNINSVVYTPYYPNTTYPYYPQTTTVVQQGWECPKCKRVYSPCMVMCSYCPTNPVITTSTDTDG